MTELLARILGRPLFAPETGDGGGEPASELAPPPVPTDSDVSDDDASESDEPEEAEEAEESDDENEDGEPRERKPAAPVEDEEDEVDFGFKKYKLKKELAQVVKNWQASTTQKEQFLAEQRRALQAEAEAQVEFAEEVVTKKGALANAEAKIQQYLKLDWSTLEQENPQLAQTRMRELQQWNFYRDQKRAEVANLDAKAAEAREQRALKSQEETLGRVQQAAMSLHRDIPTWSEDAPKVAEFAERTYGFTPQELGRMDDARMGKALHDAWKLASLAQKQKAAVQKAAPARAAAPAPAPLETVAARGSGTPARKSLVKLAESDDMSAFAESYKKTYGKRR